MPSDIGRAYCLTVHKDESQVKRLIERLMTPKSYFFVKVFRAEDAETKQKWKETLESFRGPNFHYELVERGVWGAFGQVQTTLDAMAHFQSIQYDYFINLSGQCYPLMSHQEIDDFFHGNDLAYMVYFPMPSTKWNEGGMPRLNYHHIRVKERRFIKIPRLKRGLPCGLQPYGGSNWLSLHRRHVDYILSFVRDHPEVLRFYSTAISPDEMFFQTILMNSPLNETIVCDDLRYTDWSKKGVPLPAIITNDDLPTVLRSGKMFCRKIDIKVDPLIMDAIDGHIRMRNKLLVAEGSDEPITDELTSQRPAAANAQPF